MTFVDYMRAARRSWWLIILLTAVGAFAAVIPARQTSTSYRATAAYVVGPGAAIDAGTIDDAVRNLTEGTILNTLALVLESDEVVTAAAEDIGLAPVVRRQYDVHAFAVNQTAAAQVEVVGPSRTIAARLVESIGRRGTQDFEALYRSFDSRPLTTARTTSARRDPIEYGTAGAACGFVIGALIAVARYAVHLAGGLTPTSALASDRRRGRRLRRRSRDRHDHGTDSDVVSPARVGV